MAFASAVGATKRVIALEMRVSLVLTPQACNEKTSGARVLASHGSMAASVAAFAVIVLAIG